MTKQKRIKILIAEDNYLIAEEISRTIENLGYAIVGVAVNGIEAVELTEKLKPDVVLMDIKMPEMDGLEASRRIQQSQPTPIVVLTAYESSEMIEKGAEAGIAAFLTKPPEAKMIERAVTIAIARFANMMKLNRLNDSLKERNAELEQALELIESLEGMLPVCANCKKIRDDNDNWVEITNYIRERTKVEFTHGFCPDCYEELYGDIMREKKGEE
jgi:two-component system, response regulator PdtaR